MDATTKARQDLINAMWVVIDILPMFGVKYDPDQPRDEGGRWTSDGGDEGVSGEEDTGESGGGGWRPNMTRDEAEEWNKDSAIKDAFYHGTGRTERGVITPDNELQQRIQSIENDGFEVPEGYTNGHMLGNGIYLTPSAETAERYGTVLETRINVSNPFVTTQREWSTQYGRIVREMKKEGIYLPTSERINWWAQRNGHDAIYITNGLKQIVIFDRENITVVK